MSFWATPHQILKLAMRAEEVGRDFYRALGQKTKDLQVKNICMFLAEEEVEHRQTFAQMDRELSSNDEKKEFAVDILAAMTQGIKALQDTGFASADFSADTLTVKKCLAVAIHVEKETVDMYQMIQGALVHKGFQEVIYNIICEERRHAETLENVLAVLNGQKAREKIIPESKGPSETVAFNDIDKKVIVEKKVIKTRRIPEFQGDYMYLLLIIFCFIGLTLAMLGPRFFMKVIELIKSLN